MKGLLLVGICLCCGGDSCLFGEPEIPKPVDPGTEVVEGAEIRGQRERSASESREELEAAVMDGFDWLMAQQGTDGGWHSATYGSMRGGASLTSLVLYTASTLPKKMIEPHAEALRNGWGFLAPGLRGVGKVSAPDGESDYPTYATGLLLCALNRLDLGETPEDIEALLVFLCRVQLDEDHGFEKGNPDYGGWDLMGDEKREGKSTGTNISVSRFVLEGLEAHRKREDVGIAIAVAKTWVGGLQNLESDGGFYFHPEGGHLGNKAGWSDKEQKNPRSYGTCTADGLVALAILAAGDSDEAFADRMKAAAGWLEKGDGVAEVPGFEFDPPERGWEQGLRYYYMMSLSGTFPLVSLEMAADRGGKIRSVLLKEQTEAGGWVNSSARMREDDPIIATCFALAALGRLADR